MWGRRRRKDDAQVVLAPEQSFWQTHPDPAARPDHVTASGTSLTVTVNGTPVDPDSALGHTALAALAKQGKLTEHHVVETTRTANPEQQKQITELLLQKQAGSLTEQDFARRVLEIMAQG